MNTLKPKRKNVPTRVKKWYLSGYDRDMNMSKEITAENSKKIKHEKEVIKDRNKANKDSRERINSLLIQNYKEFLKVYKELNFTLAGKLSKIEIIEIAAKRLFGIKLDAESKKLKFILTTVKANNVSIDFSDYTIATAYKYLKAFKDGKISKSSLRSLAKAKQAFKIYETEQKQIKKEKEIKEAIQKIKNQGL